MRKLLAAVGVAITLAACTLTATSADAADAPFDVLVFSKTAGFRHDAIPAGIQAIRELGAGNGFTVTASEDAGVFTAAGLAPYEAVVFLSTTGDVLNDSQQNAFESYIRNGGGYLGVHAAADTEYDWPFYGTLVGAWFASHPAIQSVKSITEDRAHPGTAHLPPTWTRTDELYNYRSNPRTTAHVLASLDESSYSGGTMGDHPITWCKTLDSGRSFYTGWGHTQESYADANFRAQLLGGLRYVSRRVNADCRPETGYTPLYNGSTTGWSQAGPGGFSNTDATLTSNGGLGLLWYSAKQFGSYSLKADWRLTGDSNSGVFVGFPNPGADPWVAVNQGYEVQIDATDAVDRTTGSIYTFKAADLAARDAALNPPGSWNSYELLVEGQRLRVYLNGVLINDFTNTDPARNLDGYIGLQNHGTGDEASFRNVRIKELGTPPATGVGPVTGLAGKCLDVRGAVSADGTQVQLYTCNGTGAQSWTRTGSTLRALGRCLDVSGGGTADGTKVQLWTCNGSGAQNWTPATDGTLRNPQSAKCLTVAGSGSADSTVVQLGTCGSGANQKWALP
jgi:type 1 glutamine amidotransferase